VPLLSSQHEDALHDWEPGGKLHPADAGVLGREHSAVGRPEREEGSLRERVETVGIDVVVEPLGESGPAALERSALEIPAVDGTSCLLYTLTLPTIA
jgi:hypothetical protein